MAVESTKLVDKIKALMKRGMTGKEIALALNEEGLKTKIGTAFTESTVRGQIYWARKRGEMRGKVKAPRVPGRIAATLDLSQALEDFVLDAKGVPDTRKVEPIRLVRSQVREQSKLREALK